MINYNTEIPPTYEAYRASMALGRTNPSVGGCQRSTKYSRCSNKSTHLRQTCETYSQYGTETFGLKGECWGAIRVIKSMCSTTV